MLLALKTDRSTSWQEYLARAESLTGQLKTARSEARMLEARAEAAEKQIAEFKLERDYVWGFNAGFDEAKEQFTARAETAEERAAALHEKLHHIRQWCDAYPLDIFPEPDFIKARAALAEHGMTLDALSAATARRVLEGIMRLIDETGPA
jgi:chromosome segregation ATPase